MKLLLSAIPHLRLLAQMATAFSLAFSGQVLAQEPIKIAFIDPHPVSSCATGESSFMVLDFAADYF